MCKKYNIKITWIPREINIVADKVAKLQPTKKDDTFYTIDFIYDLIFFQAKIIWNKIHFYFMLLKVNEIKKYF
ncbi:MULTISPECIES: ribonuclease H family protein [Aliarcobacter]|uniref:hypothetical protein n=1 Tax=Aliarcobacter TaxID=2321111 RepID=UPI0021B46578|nr:MULTISPECIES: hypothetical protein [Aliarcobacter]MCT7464583.1 hypothetical protein [Aliarcobacter cryaerophilus]MCT7633000.1 hypothetical protein [Aliarcobacter butzleri]